MDFFFVYILGLFTSIVTQLWRPSNFFFISFGPAGIILKMLCENVLKSDPQKQFDFVTFQLVLNLLLVLVIFCIPKEVNSYQACIRFQYQKALMNYTI